MPRAKSDDRKVAVVDYQNGYGGLVDAFRARANEMAIAVGGASAAEISGLPSSYLAKLLSPSPKPARRFGAISLGPVLGVLGLKLVVMTDEKAVKKFGTKLEKRQERCAHHSAAVRFNFSHHYMQKLGQKGQQVLQQRRQERLQVKNQLSEMKRKAVMVRWKKYYETAANAASQGLAQSASGPNRRLADAHNGRRISYSPRRRRSQKQPST